MKAVVSGIVATTGISCMQAVYNTVKLNGGQKSSEGILGFWFKDTINVCLLLLNLILFLYIFSILRSSSRKEGKARKDGRGIVKIMLDKELPKVYVSSEMSTTTKNGNKFGRH